MLLMNEAGKNNEVFCIATMTVNGPPLILTKVQ